jgi:nucleoside-diphosphate-sugar epimerase
VVLARLFPEIAEDYQRWGWRMFPTLDRVYVNDRARKDLGWTPQYDFPAAVKLVRAGESPRSPLAATVGAKGYHSVPTGIYTR